MTVIWLGCPMQDSSCRQLEEVFDCLVHGVVVTLLVAGSVRSKTEGKRILCLKLYHPRQLAPLHFSHIAAGNRFTTAELHPQTAQAPGCSTQQYRLSFLAYHLFKLRPKGLVEKLPHSRRYCLLPNGFRIC